MSSDDMAKEFEDPPQRLAMLLRGGLPPAKCRVLIEGDHASVYPKDKSIVGTSLSLPVTLKMLETESELVLCEFEWHAGCTHGDGLIQR